MRGRLRYLIALAFLGGFFLVPAPDAREGRPYLAYLQVREWLLAAADSPLVAWRDAGRAPQLAVDLRLSPPIEDAAELTRRSADYVRLAAEWALGPGRPAAGATAPLSPVVLPLLVRVGEAGVRAELPRADGGAWIQEAVFPTRWSLLPALVAITLAVLTRRVLLALLCGGLAGAIAWAAAHGSSGPAVLAPVVDGVLHFFGSALWRRSLGEDFYLRITAFVVFLFMTIGIITKNGGVHGLVARLQRIVRGPTSAQFSTFATGVAVFFDDYTNCLLVGTTMRPLTDGARVSREKLAYIVDSTAAPVAGLSVFSTWIVYEMSTYRAPLTMVTRPDGTPYTETDAFGVFLDTLPYRFYSWFALALVVLVVLLRRDFGPMLRAEQRARHRGRVLGDDAQPMAAVDDRIATPAPDTPRRAVNALLPLAVLVLGTIALMLWQGVRAAGPLPEGAGFGDHLRAVLANAQSDVALLFASIAGWLSAVALTLGQRLLSWRSVLFTSLAATRALYLAFGILFLAWSLGHICRDLGTSFFLTASARHAMTAALLPLLLFLVAGAVSFATGTSFGTMAILLPNVVVLAHQLGTDAAFGGDAATGGTALMLLSIGAVLEGSIFGDHCSPISDTTVLSSLGAQCDLLAHVTTQLPYALLTMAAAAGCGYLPVLWFGPAAWPFSMLAGLGLLAGVLRWAGRDPAASPK